MRMLSHVAEAVPAAPAAPTTGPVAQVRAKPRSGPGARLSGGTIAALLAVAGLVIILATDQVAPATSERQAQLRIWLTTRAAGFTALMLLSIQVALGLVLSHPTNKSTWKLSKLLFPWHENAWVFVLAFLAAHIVAIVLDGYADVGLVGAFLPGLSHYRSPAVALGTMALYAMLATGLTARYTKLLPAGVWLKLHRLSLVVFALAWLHGVLAGTDSVAMASLYGASGMFVLAAGAYRYWVSRQARPTFATALKEAS
jgi:predicted ferric reductase